METTEWRKFTSLKISYEDYFGKTGIASYEFKRPGQYRFAGGHFIVETETTDGRVKGTNFRAAAILEFEYQTESW